jgi:hypothetical protein
MAKKIARPKAIYKPLERAAYETRYGVESLCSSFHLSQKRWKRRVHVLSAMPQSTMSELLTLHSDLNKLFQGIVKAAKNSD